VAHLGAVVEHPTRECMPEVMRSRLDGELLGVLADDQPDRLSLQAALTVWPWPPAPRVVAKEERAVGVGSRLQVLSDRG
jgi:hypothetical protein